MRARNGIEQAAPDGGDRVQTSGAVALHRGRDLGGRRCGDEDDRVAGLPLLERDRPCPHVKERVGTDHRSTRFEEGRRNASEDVDPVRENCPFRSAGRAAGEEHDVRIALTHDDTGVLGLERRRLDGQRGERKGVEFELGRLDEPSPRDGMIVVDQQKDRTQTTQHLGELRLTPQTVQRCEYGPELGQSGEHGDDVEARPRPGRDSVAVSDTTCRQRL